MSILRHRRPAARQFLSRRLANAAAGTAGRRPAAPRQRAADTPVTPARALAADDDRYEGMIMLTIIAMAVGTGTIGGVSGVGGCAIMDRTRSSTGRRI